MKNSEYYIISIILLLLPQLVTAQLFSVSGHVTNGSTGEIIKFASVFDSASGIGTISNNKGFYQLLLKPGKMKLKISNSGYEAFTKTFELHGDTVLSVQLNPNIPVKGHHNSSEMQLHAGIKLDKRNAVLEQTSKKK